MIPRATYRLQFHKEFGFDDATAVAEYLGRLGVSHVYASPWLKARPGSLHGYDIVDYGMLNPDLGDGAAFERMLAAFERNGLHQILDFVPNHMGVGGSDNPFWLDVLEWGPDSIYAGWFDIDWNPDRRYLHEKVLVPFLGDQYGVELANGKLELRFDADAGSFAVWAYGVHKFPIYPFDYARILGQAHPELERFGDAFASLSQWRPHIARHAQELKRQLAIRARDQEDVRAAIDAAVDRLNGKPGDEASWAGLHSLIQDQYWRAAHFRVAADDINYRRFFNINDLAGVRMEFEDVFQHAHAFVFQLLNRGLLDGLRIDHVDGLLNPKEYLHRLRKGPATAENWPAYYLVVEKILAHHEVLREDWPVDGTTGYDFLNLVLGLLIDPAGEEPLTRLYRDFIRAAPAFPQMVRECKSAIMENDMASELNVLARDAARIARQNPKTADFTHNILRRVLKEIIACFPVYRIYLDEAGVPTEADRRDLEWALKQARSNEPQIDPSVFDFVSNVLSGDLVVAPRSGFSRQAVLRFAMHVQQYSGPVMAKGLEDTAFYRYNRFVALNEVGGNPEHFGLTVYTFHKANSQRLKHWPHTMLSTSSHDTKRGEDVRARLAVLSELADDWTRHVQIWSRILRARRGDVEGTAPPDRDDEYLFYQNLIGAWPAELTGYAMADPAALQSFVERMKAVVTKSIREARVKSTWAMPNLEYENAALGFVEESLDPERSQAFFAAFLPFQERVATLGVRNSLAQTVLKLTAPGVPDIYQGADLWDLSMVDPDNRRPVDYARRIAMLGEVENLSEIETAGESRAVKMRRLLADWRDGAIKLAIIRAILHFRRDNPELFSSGSYEPLTVSGSKSSHICCFARSISDRTIVVAVTRLPAALSLDPDWGDTAIAVPEEFRTRKWTDILTGEKVGVGELGFDPRSVFGVLPVAVLAAE